MPIKLAPFDWAASKKWHATGLSIYQVRCRSWFNRVTLAVGRPALVFPDKQTFPVSVGMSQRCHKWTPDERKHDVSLSYINPGNIKLV